MSERGEVSFGDARIKYRVVRSPRRRKTIEVTVDEPALVTVAAPVDTPPKQLEAAPIRRVTRTVETRLRQPCQRSPEQPGQPHHGRQHLEGQLEPQDEGSRFCPVWWAILDSNQRPLRCQRSALTI